MSREALQAEVAVRQRWYLGTSRSQRTPFLDQGVPGTGYQRTAARRHRWAVGARRRRPVRCATLAQCLAEGRWRPPTTRSTPHPGTVR